MYLQWTSIDVGYPDYREANRIFFLYWEACKDDNRCFVLDYLNSYFVSQQNMKVSMKKNIVDKYSFYIIDRKLFIKLIMLSF